MIYIFLWLLLGALGSYIGRVYLVKAPMPVLFLIVVALAGPVNLIVVLCYFLPNLFKWEI